MIGFGRSNRYPTMGEAYQELRKFNTYACVDQRKGIKNKIQNRSNKIEVHGNKNST